MPVLNERRRQINEEFNLVVGTNLRHFRLRRDLTQAEVAEAASMDITTLSRIEQGVRSINLREATCIAKLLDVTIEALCRRQRHVHYGVNNHE